MTLPQKAQASDSASSLDQSTSENEPATAGGVLQAVSGHGLDRGNELIERG